MNFSTSANIGDVAWHLQFLRRLGGEHVFYIKREYIAALSELMEDTNVVLAPVDERPDGTVDTWIANAQFEKHGLFFRNEPDIIGYLLQWFNHMGGLYGLPCPLFADRKQLLWNHPGLRKREPDFDVLFLNIQPLSGQCPGYSQSEVDQLVRDLMEKRSVVAAQDFSGYRPFSLSVLAELSTRCRLLVGTPSGPWWFCQNEVNQHIPRIAFLEPMRLDYGEGIDIRHVPNAAAARVHLQELGVL